MVTPDNTPGEAPPIPPRAPALSLDVQWRAGRDWYCLRASCGPGLTAVSGQAAPGLLRLLAGRHVAHRGSVLLDGRPLAHGSALMSGGPYARPVAAAFACDPLPLWRTPRGVVTGAVRAHGVPRSGAAARGMQALGWMDAAHLARRPLAFVNTADRQRVALARALGVVPGLLLLDRPGAPLPPPERQRLYATLGRLARTWEMVVLLTQDADPDGALPVLVPRPVG